MPGAYGLSSTISGRFAREPSPPTVAWRTVPSLALNERSRVTSAASAGEAKAATTSAAATMGTIPRRAPPPTDRTGRRLRIEQPVRADLGELGDDGRLGAV